LSDSLAALTNINLNDLVAAFGWQQQPVLSHILRRVFYNPAQKFASQMLDFDRVTGECGLPDGARCTLPYFVHNVQVFGLENLPKTGPALYLANHPGMTDTLCLFAAIARLDLRILALDRPFLKALPNVSKQLFYLSDDPSKRTDAVKKAATHLRNGSAVLTFPAGSIEPDPDVFPGALESLNDWTDSAGVFMRFAPEMKIVPVLVRCVVWDKAVKHPLTWLRSKRKDREWLGTSLQLLSNVMFDTRPVTVRVQFAKPIDASQVNIKDLASIHAAVLERMSELIQNPPQEEGVSVL
jgi:1-acyl-sn-glycerol-3-phosphate acyltransferase